LLGISSCADDTEVGSGLLGNNDLEVIFLDDFDLALRQLGPSPLPQIGLGLPFEQRHSLGSVENPEFGTLSASFHIRPQLPNNSIAPNFENATLDSVALILKVDTTLFYGDPRSFHNISVFNLEETYINSDTISTDRLLTRSLVPIGESERVVLSELDSIPLLGPTGLTTFFSDALSITLNRRFGANIFQDNERNNNQEGIAELINGFYVASESGNAIAQFDLNDEVSSLLFFYKDSLGFDRNFPYRLGSYHPAFFEYDISGSNLDQALQDDSADDRFFLQGHAGATIEIDISDVLTVEDPFINLVTLEFFVDQKSLIDSTRFNYPVEVDLSTVSSNGLLTPVVDLSIGQELGQTFGIFNGSLSIDNQAEIVRYEMNITNHVKDVFRGLQSPILYLTVRDRVQNPNSVVLFGPNHPTFPTKLKLTYTKS